jgi:predicted nucleic acid-binding protein
VRLSSNPTVIKNAVNPADAITLLRRMRAHPGHRFWQKLPRLDALGHLGLAGHQQVTDAYLALVAKANDGVLATFDAAVAAWFRREKLIEVLPT